MVKGPRDGGVTKKRHAYANRRPVLDTANAIPEELLCAIRDSLAKIQVLEGQKCEEKLHKALKVVVQSLGKLSDPSQTSTPELQIQALSRITGCIKETPMGNGKDQALSETEFTVVDILTHEMVVPLLLDCRVRYLHRGLTTLLRAICRRSEDDMKKMEVAFVHSVEVLCSKPTTRNTVSMNDPDERALPFPSPPLDHEEIGERYIHCKNAVMIFLNNIDSLSSTLIPFVPSIFSRTFTRILPMLGDALRWCVGTVTTAKRYKEMDALLQSCREEGEDSVTATTAVLGEDLEQIRFCVRVVASYVHKYMNQLSQYDFSTLCQLLCGFLEPSITMLSSYRFPKDVLNATALLVASLITVKHCNAKMIGLMCSCICDESHVPMPNAEELKNARPKNDTGNSYVYTTSRNPLEKVVGWLCCDNSPAQESSEIHRDMQFLFSKLTTHGRFALLKGLLAHFSSPLNGHLETLSVLLESVPHLVQTQAPNDVIRKDGTILYDLIVPLCCKYFHRVDLPETRFMAIQTMDCIVRHLAAVLEYICRLTNGAQEHTLSNQSADFQRATTRLREVCVRPGRVGGLSRLALQLSMEVWDDNTTQVSGALYDTYNVLLSLNKCMMELMTQFPELGNETLSHREESLSSQEPSSLLDIPSTLRAVLSIQNDRRGKYHALLGLLSAMRIEDFLHGLCLHYGSTDEEHVPSPLSSATVGTAVETFCKTLLSGAANHKVASVAGDTMTKLVEKVEKELRSAIPKEEDTPNEGRHAMLQEQISRVLTTVALAMIQPRFVRSASNVSTATHISHISAHFVCPLLKFNKSFVDGFINAMMNKHGKLDNDNHNEVHEDADRLSQSIVEVLTRARGVGIDVAPYLQKESKVFPIIIQSLRNYKFEQRIAALHLCILSPKKGERIAAWQSSVVEEFVSRNMHCGGDSAARKTLVSTVQKWINRLVESFESTKSIADLNKNIMKRKEDQRGLPSTPGSSEAPDDSHKAYVSAVFLPHVERLADILEGQIGTCLSESQGLSVERKVTVCACYKLLLQSFRRNSKLHEATEHLIYRHTVVVSLLTDLSDGWSQMRHGAKQLLDELASGSRGRIFQQYLSSSTDAKTLLDKSFNEILTICTYRGAEGAVQRYMLFSKLVSMIIPEHEVSLVSILGKCLNLLGSFCSEVENLRGKELYEFITQHPVHGLLSLCTELFDTLFHSLSSKGEGLGCGASSAVEWESLTNQLFHSSKSVIRTCGALAGHEVVADGEVVDCRGHVYDKSNEASEAVMRYVVNNTWLGIRVATMCLQRATSLVDITGVDYDTIRSLSYELVNALLVTKHNGVMRCVRSALKTLMQVLVRCRSPQFYHLPSELLLFLMGSEGVASEDISRMLRRSQGLPHAILAVLEAEDESVPPVLFPVAMRTLLRISQFGYGQSQEEGAFDSNDPVRLSQRSNAMNVLKFIFENKAFAEKVVADVESAFMIATSGFDHTSWNIRNSSLMLFSAVLQRFVGEHPSTGGGGVNTSLHDITLRTPKGLAYAYEALKRGMERERVDFISQGSSVWRANNDLAMFPLLQMLSMLSPDPPHLASSAATDDRESDMIKVVISCSESRNLMIRAASAVALPCLVPPSRIGKVIGRIPLQREGVKGSTLNWCHGSLLQLQNFHSTYVGTLRRKQRIVKSPYACQDLSQETIKAVAEVLLSCEEFYQSAAGCCPTVCACLFHLLADVIYYGNETFLVSEIAPAGDRDDGVSSLLRRLLVFGAKTLQSFMTSATVLCRWSRAGGTAALEAAGLFFVFATRIYSHWTSDCRAIMTQVCQAASEEPLLSPSVDCYGSFHSAVIRHLYAYYKEGLCTGEDLLLLVDTMRDSLHLHLTQRSMVALTKGLQHGFSAELRSWHLSDQTDHLHFLSVIGSMRPISKIENVPHNVEEQLLIRLTAVTSSPHSSTAWCSAALQFLCTAASQCQLIPPALLTALESLGAPQRPQLVRLAALDALAALLPLVRESHLNTSPLQVALLLLQLLAFLVDDSFDIRERACTVCCCVLGRPKWMFTNHGVTLCCSNAAAASCGMIPARGPVVEEPQSCAIYVVSLLRLLVCQSENEEAFPLHRARCGEKENETSILTSSLTNSKSLPPLVGLDAELLRRYYIAIVNGGGGGGVGAATEGNPSPVNEDDDDDIAEDEERGMDSGIDKNTDGTLFHKENDNMYAEPTVLKYYEAVICSISSETERKYKWRLI